MNENQHNQLKWLIFALLLFIAVFVMYYKHRPIKEVEEKIEYPTYKMY